MTDATTGTGGPTRRAVLLAPVLGAVGAAAACTSGGDGPDEAPGPHPDVVLADEAAERERRLLAAYDSALALAPALAERLAPLRAEHAEHLSALGVPELPAPAPADPSAGAPASPDPAPTPPPLPADPPGLLTALADLERTTSTSHAGAAVRSGRGLAVVLASAAASEASHVVALA